MLQKYAVVVGGGQNHRMHLGDAILIKDNHLKVLAVRIEPKGDYWQGSCPEYCSLKDRG